MLHNPARTYSFLNSWAISLFPTSDNRFEKVTLRLAERHVGTRDLLIASQLGIRCHHNTALQCMWLMDYVNRNLKKNIYLLLRFSWPFKKCLTPHGNLVCYINYLTSNFQLVQSSKLAYQKFRFSVEGASKDIQSGVSKYLSLSSIFYSMCGSVVVKAVCYKPEGLGFDNRWGVFFKFA
jgi:hypothetical protein